MSGVIPKEQLSDVKRWEIGSFGSDREKPATSRPAPAPAQPTTGGEPKGGIAATPPGTAPVSPLAGLPTAADIERMHEEAHAAGYQAGFEEGRQEGLAQGKEEGRPLGEAEGKKAGQAALDQKAAELGKLVGNLRRSLNDLNQEMAEPLLDLALEIASQVLRGAVRYQRDAMLAVIREAIDSLPLHHAHIVLYLHPEDAANVRDLTGEQLTQHGTQIIEDSQIKRGGCRVKAGTSEVDATLETRWRRVLENLGADPENWTITP